ncbi:Translation initiation factor IF-1 [Morus notabilis]|uniref:Translation initiation factor IF-1, chloroplastic n=1 Tax=Morus notabilis TaxID=981085 RepID=W9QRF2_9ROSA|nr:uncharacterized protein LOC21386482 [Morus notabilis]EXB51377.1 Translation initiation factor IF-1 [Morus notabilis]
MWSSTSLQHALLHLPLPPTTPNPKPCFPIISSPINPESQFSLRTPTFSAAKQNRSPFVVTAKAPGSKDSAEQQKWSQEGLVTESLPNGMFRIRLDNADMIIGYISGKIRKSFIRILPGDRVKVEVSRYDSTRGRIVYRLRSNKDSS